MRSVTLLLLLCAGCAPKAAITVGSKNFTEQLILGEILAQHIETKLGIKADRKLNLGGTLLAHQALVSGAIDLYPEYTGTALTAVLKLPASSDPSEVLNRVRSEYQRQWKLEWMPPFGFNNTFAMVVRAADTTATSLSEAAHHPSGWRLGAGYEFLQRADGLPGLQRVYHLPLLGAPVSMDLGLLYRALEQKQVDMAAANSTDGMLSVLPVRVLADDRRFFPPYQAAAVVRSEALARVPGLQKALEELGGRIDDQAMRRLNYEIDGKHRPIADVARDFLKK
jgi:osmoprotectant transport system substrate-binding protein